MIERVDAIHKILADVEIMLRERLREMGAELPHILAAIGPQGNIIVLGEIDPVTLQKMARELAEYAEEAVRRRHASESLSVAS